MDNDGKVQYATARKRCSPTPIFLSVGAHILYIEGWSSTEVLSISATYQGPDTGNTATVIPAYRNPFGPPPVSFPGDIFSECNPKGLVTGDSNFTICAYNAKSNSDIGNLAQFFTFYLQVRGVPFPATLPSLLSPPAPSLTSLFLSIPPLRVHPISHSHSLFGCLLSYAFKYPAYGFLLFSAKGKVCWQSQDDNFEGCSKQIPVHSFRSAEPSIRIRDLRGPYHPQEQYTIHILFEI